MVSSADVRKFCSVQKKLWPVSLLIIVGLFFLLGGLYNSCDSCTSDVAWLSRRPPLDLSSAQIASDFPLSPRFAPVLEVRPLDDSVNISEEQAPDISEQEGRQLDNSVHIIEELVPSISKEDNYTSETAVNSPSGSPSEEILVEKKDENSELETEEADQFHGPASQNLTAVVDLDESAYEKNAENSELETEEADQFHGPASQNLTGVTDPEELAYEKKVDNSELKTEEADQFLGPASQNLTAIIEPEELAYEKKAENSELGTEEGDQIDGSTPQNLTAVIDPEELANEKKTENSELETEEADQFHGPASQNLTKVIDPEELAHEKKTENSELETEEVDQFHGPASQNLTAAIDPGNSELETEEADQFHGAASQNLTVVVDPEEVAHEKKAENSELETEEADQFHGAASQNSTAVVDPEGLPHEKKTENSEPEREEADQFHDFAAQNATTVKASEELAHEKGEGNSSNWLASQETPNDRQAESQGENTTLKTRTSEQDLLAAKEEIFFKTTVETDAFLRAHVYRNLTLFIKSYRLMEETLKIFVYEDGSNPLFHTGPMTGIYASEGRFINQLVSSSPFFTSDPRKAHLFFLPFSVTHMVDIIYVPGSHDMHPIINFVTNYVTKISSEYPYWNMSHGADHFFVSCHDWGPAVARGHAELRRNAIKVVCNADLNEEFVLSKDASLPETYMRVLQPPKRLGGRPARKRPFLAFFAGQMHGRVRPLLLQHWQDKFPEMKIYGRIPSRIARKNSYIRHMKMSKYCICPMGYEVNSPRIVEAIYYDCVPVIIADDFVLPFSDVLDWPAFSVSVNESDIPRLRDILLSIPETKYRSMQASLTYVRQHFSWNFPNPVKYDIFHMILHSVWLRRLAALPDTNTV